MEIRLLRADEIECRVQSTKKTSSKVGCILLLYKDARVDQKILDESVGNMYWQRDHKELKGNIYCGIGIYDKEEKQWVYKWDCGAESNTEKEKGEASDSFKRAGFNWGIGRELYTSPFIWVDLREGEYYEKDNKASLNANVKFSVKSIGYNDNKEIVSLEIVDNKHIVRYTLGKATVTSMNEKHEDKPSDKSTEDKKYICDKCRKPITAEEKSYSEKKFGKLLCRDCQKNPL
jgi:hypothetical protein